MVSIKKKTSFRYVLIPLIMIVGLILYSFPINVARSKPKSALDPSPILYAGAMDTGAASASRDYKGGIIFLEPNTQYTMKGGTYSGGNKTYGGSVYISEGATFTMDGGTITNCKATYGGGIYVRAGATCNILSGSITNCSATYGPAIFVEDGGILNIEDGVEISDNDIYQDSNVSIEISDDTLAVGNPSAGLNLHYTYFGSYPQTHVSDSTLISQLNNLKSGSSVGTYTSGSYSWTAYSNTDGEIYVFGTGKGYDSDSLFKDGSKVSSSGDWFKVEPIRWFVLNYDSKGSEGYELLSELVLAGNVIFDSSTNVWANSNIRTWCNGEFLNKAFTSEEQNLINVSNVKNNVTNNYSSSTSDGSGTPTEDKIYLKSYYEMNSGLFTSNSLRLAAPSDFAVANYVVLSGSGYPTAHRTDRAAAYWLRSAGSSASYACFVHIYGSLYYDYYVLNVRRGVRPALHLNI